MEFDLAYIRQASESVLYTRMYLPLNDGIILSRVFLMNAMKGVNTFKNTGIYTQGYIVGKAPGGVNTFKKTSIYTFFARMWKFAGVNTFKKFGIYTLVIIR